MTQESVTQESVTESRAGRNCGAKLLENEVFRSFLEPGQWVRHPDHPEWGVGQVQSAVSHRVTVNFEHVGKIALDARQVTLVVL